MKLPSKTLFVVVLIVVAAVLSVLGWMMYTLATLQSDRDVATGVNISTDWIEITPQPPLKATKQVHHLIITVDGYKRSVDDTRNELPLPDGTLANPEVELVDESGETYRLRPSLLTSSGVGYIADDATHSPLPANKAFTKIRIRSGKPFRAAKIIWQNVNLM